MTTAKDIIFFVGFERKSQGQRTGPEVQTENERRREMEKVSVSVELCTLQQNKSRLITQKQLKLGGI